MTINEQLSGWISVCGKEDFEIEKSCEENLLKRKAEKSVLSQTIKDVIEMRLPLSGVAMTEEQRLDKLRRLCQLWDVDVRVNNISSHRKVIGPFIVLVKKILFPFLKVLLKDFIEQQREFNATTILLLSEINNSISKGRDGTLE